MVTVINNPLGHKLSDTIVSAEITNDGGAALVGTIVSHTLSDGDYVYIESNIDAYNGFRYVDSVSYNTFKIKESENGDYIEYKQDADISYQVSILQHGWQCVHQPIVYELESDLSPNNTAEEDYVPATVVSYENNQGYVQLNLSVALTDPTELAKIELVGAGSLAGVYQIINVLQPWSVVIDLAYSATYSFTGLVVVKYYDNYVINVNVYAGLLGGHRWETVKPVELLATLQYKPDENNRVKFSINEILRAHIQTRNNLTLDTLPNNTDFMTGFYISVFESYDQSDGEDITTFTDEETTDSFNGNAVNAKNEFKNVYSGHLSEYINEGSDLAPWLTDFDVPIAIVGYFFDISFINILNGVDIVINIEKSTGGITTDTETMTIENPGNGIIRVPITPESGFDRYCLQASTPGAPGTSESVTLPALSDWLNHSTGDEAWTLGATPTVTIPSDLPNTLETDYLYTPFSFEAGYDYTITLNYTRTFISGLTSPKNSILRILNDSFGTIFSSNQVAASGANTISITFTASSDTTIIAFKHVSGASVTIDVTGRSASRTSPAIPSQTITEQICISILEECDSTLDADLRLLEAGPFRILE